MVKAIAIIPARGGSTRIPKKNIINFFDLPMIAYTIKACIDSNKFDKVLVSTDNEEIAEISLKYGAEVPFLRTECTDNLSTVSDAIIHATQQAEKYWNEEYEIIAMAMPNCPLRTSVDISNAFDNFIEKKYQSQISCFKFGFMNPWWALKLDKNFSGKRILDIPNDTRSQDLPELYCPTGAIWIANKAHLEKYKSFYGNHNFFEIDWKNGVDIDNYEDIEVAKVIYAMTNKV